MKRQIDLSTEEMVGGGSGGTLDVCRQRGWPEQVGSDGRIETMQQARKQANDEATKTSKV
jgi:hypothetical protein